ncbi:PREDICTED: interferon alpha-inducible protein 27-like protein 2B [Amphimedon queenslandica]|uniref:Uncharacterized protein n=1 Tax=Amphimedon queenslandica TaxID=400682 RepID=A0AAN0JAW8_AMPQE|nr:PREDICTED: interferon alpha-inducible protein 27-like protein 2B [Amphimedon queenslandica]|eukprot:XP_019853823.1 PREDICTED: interferon alpha-inducible protein 27-like protein 2B [Amphimedon queenslandica]
MLFSKKYFVALFLSYLIFSVQANTSCPDGCKEEKEESGYNYWLIGAAAVGGGVVAVATAPVIISGLGFTAGGIAANSIAASMMSAWGPTAAGGVVSTLQSAGVIGLSVGAKVGIGAVGAVIGAAVGTAATKLQSNGQEISFIRRLMDSTENLIYQLYCITLILIDICEFFILIFDTLIDIRTILNCINFY